MRLFKPLAFVTVLASALLFANVHAQTTVKLGISGGVMEDIAEAAQKAAARQGEIAIVTTVFSGHLNANGPVNDGDIDANAFQHVPYLQGQIKANGYQLVPIGHTLVAPLGIYSKKHASLADLPVNAIVGIPGDDSNRNRALLLLQQEGVIALRPDFDAAKGENATTLDIVSNPKNIQIKEIDSMVLARALDDVDAGAIITAQASQAGLLVARDAIAAEKPGGAYTNVLVVQAKNKDAAWTAPLVQAFQSDEVKALLEGKYKGTLLPAF